MSLDLAPRHLRLRETLLRRWKAAGLKVGDRIESQNEIRGLCNFSLITITKTLKDLESEGVIRRQVGKGSYLLRTPWAEAYHRVGFFYNRDVVGGGIFDNAFYTRLVIALERAVVSDGHEFVLGSFTHAKVPMAVWDALDIIILTSITDETSLDFLDEVTGQISVIDQRIEHPRMHSFRIAYRGAFAQLFAAHGGGERYLYIDTEITSADQQRRRDAAAEAWSDARDGGALETFRANPETGAIDSQRFMDLLRRLRPAVVFGHVHNDWRPLIGQGAPGARVYPLLLDSDAPGLVVQTREWMAEILPIIYSNLDNRQNMGAVHSFAARFQP